MSVASRIEAIEEHIGDIYDTLAVSGVDTTSIDKNIVNIDSSLKERLIYFLNNGLSVVWENWDKVTGTGETLTLNNTAEAPMELSLKGNTSQSGTPTPSTPIPVNVVSGDNEVVIEGKNLLDTKFYANASSYYTLSNDNIVVISNDTRNNASINENDCMYLKSGTYTIISPSSMPRVLVQNKADGSTIINNLSSNYTTFTLTEDTLIYIKFLVPSSTFPTTFEKPMLVKGTYTQYPTPYEPYQSQTYPINLGVENIYEGSQDFSGEWQYLSSWETASETFNGCVVKKRAGSWNGTYKTFSIKAGETYTYSVYAKADEARTGGLYIDSGVTPSALNINITTEWQRYSITFTANADDNNVRPRIENTTNSTTNYTYIACYQLEKGSKLNTYTPYGTTPIELCKIGTYQDYFAKYVGYKATNTASGTVGFAGTIGHFTNSAILYNIPVLPGVTYHITMNKPDEVTKPKVVFYNGEWDGGTFTSHNGIITSRPDNLMQDISSDGNTNTNYEYMCVTTGNSSTYSQNASKLITITDVVITSDYPEDNGKWYLHKEIGKVVLNGSEDWSIANTGTASWSYQLSSSYIPKSNITSSTAFCSTYPIREIGNNDTTQGIHLITNGRLRVRWGTEDTTANYKTWLSSNNVTLYYQLATPYLSLIEDETLISQLDNIQNAMSYDTQTNIGQVNNDKPFIVSATALKDMSGE